MRPNLRCFVLTLLGLLLSAGVAFSQGGTTPAAVVSPAAQQAIADAPEGQKRALIIGASKYTEAGKLRFTVKDAEDFRNFLVKEWKFSPNSITLLTDSAEQGFPIKKTVQKFCDAMVRDLDQNSIVVVFFSGHGARLNNEDYLAPLDADLNDIAGSCVSANKLIRDIEGKRPRQALFFFDACRNPLEDEDAKPIAIKLKHEFERFGPEKKEAEPKTDPGPEEAMLYSCEPTQFSQEDPSLKQGVFTHYLLKGLAGAPDAVQNGRITFDSLKNYVRQQVSMHVSSSNGGQQKPWGLSSNGSMTMAVKGGASPPPDMDPAAPLADMAFLLFADQKYQEALAKATEATQKNPNSARSYAILGKTYIKLGQFLLALEPLERAREINRDTPGVMDALDAVYKSRPGEALVLAREAQRLFQDKLYKEAKEQALVAAGKDPNNALAYYTLGLVYEHNAEYNDALKSLQEARRLGFTEADAAYLRVAKAKPAADIARLLFDAERLIGGGSYPEGATRAREALAQLAVGSGGDSGREALAHFWLASALEGQRSFEEAEREYQTAANLDASLGKARAGIERVRVARAQSGDVLPLARDAYRLVQLPEPEYASAVAAAKKVLESGTYSEAKAPAYALAYYVLGAGAERDSSPDAARYYLYAERFDPTLGEARVGRLRVARKAGGNPAALGEEAARLASQGKWPEAEQKAALALALDPGVGAAHYALAEAYKQYRWTADSNREYEQANRLGYTAAGPVVNQAKIAAARTGLQEAVALLGRLEYVQAANKARQALAAEDSELAHAVLLNAFVELDERKSAGEEYKWFSRNQPRISLSYVGLGLYEHQMRKQYDRAENAYQEAVNRDQMDMLAHNQLGAVYYERGAKLAQDANGNPKSGKWQEAQSWFGKAAQHYLKALELGQKQFAGDEGRYYLAAAHGNLGNVFLAQQDWNQAYQAYSTAVRLYPANARFHADLAGAYLGRGEFPAADAELQEARKLGLKHHWAFDVDPKRIRKK